MREGERDRKRETEGEREQRIETMAEKWRKNGKQKMKCADLDS